MTRAMSLQLLSAFIVVCGCVGVAHADMMADSPVTFPESGALPSKYPPDGSGGPNQATEAGYYIFQSPPRSLAQIQQIHRVHDS